MEDSVTHDAAHRLELACKDTKGCRKRMDGTELFKGTKWLQDLINVLQHIMKIYKFGKNHSDLNKIAQEMGKSFLEFNLFSDTRFVEHSHRTYDHFVRMYPVLFEKLKRDKENFKAKSRRKYSNPESVSSTSDSFGFIIYEGTLPSVDLYF